MKGAERPIRSCPDLNATRWRGSSAPRCRAPRGRSRTAGTWWFGASAMCPTPRPSRRSRSVMIPTIIGPINPSGMPSAASEPTLNTTAPKMTGMLMRKLSRAAESRSKPVQRAAVIVIPDRDVPGLRASACAAPTLSESATPRSSSGRSPFCWSAHHSNKPKTINDTPMIHGSPSDSSIQSSKKAPDECRRDRRQHEQPGDPTLRRRPVVGGARAGAGPLGRTRPGRDGSSRRQRSRCRCGG